MTIYVIIPIRLSTANAAFCFFVFFFFFCYLLVVPNACTSTFYVSDDDPSSKYYTIAKKYFATIPTLLMSIRLFITTIILSAMLKNGIHYLTLFLTIFPRKSVYPRMYAIDIFRCTRMMERTKSRKSCDFVP